MLGDLEATGSAEPPAGGGARTVPLGRDYRPESGQTHAGTGVPPRLFSTLVPA